MLFLQLQEDIKAVANGTASAEKVASYTTNVIDYIAQDQNINSDDITPDISAIDDSTALKKIPRYAYKCLN